MIASKLKQWALIFSSQFMHIQYKASKQHGSLPRLTTVAMYDHLFEKRQCLSLVMNLIPDVQLKKFYICGESGNKCYLRPSSM